MGEAGNKFVALLKSRKFWAAILGIVVLFVGERAGLGTEQLTEAVAVVIAYILGVSLEDGLTRR